MDSLLTWLEGDVDGGAVVNHDQPSYEIGAIDSIYDDLFERFNRDAKGGFVDDGDDGVVTVNDDNDDVKGGGFVEVDREEEIDKLLAESDSKDFQSWLKEIIQPLLYDGTVKTNTSGPATAGEKV